MWKPDPWENLQYFYFCMGRLCSTHNMPTLGLWVWPRNKASPFSGRAHHLQAQRRPDTFFPVWRACYLIFFWHSRKYALLNFISKGETANQHFCSDILQHLWKTCSQRNPKCSTLEISFSTTTILLFILLCLGRNSWPKMAWLLFFIHLTFQI